MFACEGRHARGQALVILPCRPPSFHLRLSASIGKGDGSRIQRKRLLHGAVQESEARRLPCARVPCRGLFLEAALPSMEPGAKIRNQDWAAQRCGVQIETPTTSATMCAYDLSLGGTLGKSIVLHTNKFTQPAPQLCHSLHFWSSTQTIVRGKWLRPLNKVTK